MGADCAGPIAMVKDLARDILKNSPLAAQVAVAAPASHIDGKR